MKNGKLGGRHPDYYCFGFVQCLAHADLRNDFIVVIVSFYTLTILSITLYNPDHNLGVEWRIHYEEYIPNIRYMKGAYE